MLKNSNKDPYTQQQRQQFNQQRLGRLGGLVGGVAGSLIPIPGVGQWLGAGLGSMLGNAGGQIISGGQFNAGDMLTSGVLGGVGGAAGQALGPVAGGAIPGQILGQAGSHLIGQNLLHGPVQRPVPPNYYPEMLRPGLPPGFYR